MNYHHEASEIDYKRLLMIDYLKVTQTRMKTSMKV